MTTTGTAFNARHGGPYDRGLADAYYMRGACPHYFTGGTYSSPKITDLTPDELAAYMAGYKDGMDSGDHKDWGSPDPVGPTNNGDDGPDDLDGQDLVDSAADVDPDGFPGTEPDEAAYGPKGF